MKSYDKEGSKTQDLWLSQFALIGGLCTTGSAVGDPNAVRVPQVACSSRAGVALAARGASAGLRGMVGGSFDQRKN